MTDRAAFVVRVWATQDATANAPRRLRGSVEQVGRDGRSYFESVDRIGAIVGEALGIPETDAASGPDRDEAREPATAGGTENDAR